MIHVLYLFCGETLPNGVTVWCVFCGETMSNVLCLFSGETMSNGSDVM